MQKRTRGLQRSFPGAGHHHILGLEVLVHDACVGFGAIGGYLGGGGLNPQGISRETPQSTVPGPGLGFSGFSKCLVCLRG